MTDAYNVAADELRQFVEIHESLEAEKKGISDRQKENIAELKARGFDAKAFRALIAMRKLDPDTRAEAEAIIEMYKRALGMD